MSVMPITYSLLCHLDFLLRWEATIHCTVRQYFSNVPFGSARFWKEDGQIGSSILVQMKTFSRSLAAVAAIQLLIRLLGPRAWLWYLWKDWTYSIHAPAHGPPAAFLSKRTHTHLHTSTSVGWSKASDSFTKQAVCLYNLALALGQDSWCLNMCVCILTGFRDPFHSDVSSFNFHVYHKEKMC